MEFKREYILRNNRLTSYSDFLKSSNLQIFKPKIITLKSILDCEELSVEQKFIFVACKVNNALNNKRLTILIAEHLLQIIEKYYPNEKSAIEAIQAKKDFIDGLVSEDFLWLKRGKLLDFANDLPCFEVFNRRGVIFHIDKAVAKQNYLVERACYAINRCMTWYDVKDKRLFNNEENYEAIMCCGIISQSKGRLSEEFPKYLEILKNFCKENYSL